MARTSVFVLLALFSLAFANHPLESQYSFSATLSNEIGQGDAYQLYWSFNNTEDPKTSTISFAVKVRTTGWVGLGVSPTGDMTGSDVVIGWVNGEGNYFMHDRFADERARPPVDPSQDWFITDGTEMDGYTILQFYRNWVTCDDRDNPIETNTARVVFSWGSNGTDPANDDENTVMYHGGEQRGAISLNLLGGQTTTPKIPDDAKTFIVRVENITIPATDTTYFCQPYELDEEIAQTQRYIVKFSPLLTEISRKYVHHVLIYLCDELTSDDLESGGDCDGTVTPNIAQCRGGTVFASWAVGGGDFYYPEGIYYPFGGPTNSKHILMEMHYNNPELDAGVMDSSGFEFTYTDTVPTYEAGILTIGHAVTPLHVIPPGSESFKSTGICTSECTSNLLPDDGITVFANLLHTHLLGTGVVLRHIRKKAECELYEEEPPIDRNLQYDFNFQQLNYLPEPIKILPGDQLVLDCYYDSSDETGVTLGGERTTDEMCLAFSVYYPRSALGICESVPDLTPFVIGLPQDIVEELSDPDISLEEYRNALNSIDWTVQTESLQSVVGYGPMIPICDTEQDLANQNVEVDCPYVAPDICADDMPTSAPCDCPETEPTTKPTDGAGAITISTLLMMLCLVAFL